MGQISLNLQRVKDEKRVQIKELRLKNMYKWQGSWLGRKIHEKIGGKGGKRSDLKILLAQL